MSTGKTYSTKYLLDSNNNRGAEGQVLSTTSTGIDWVDANTVPGTGLWLANGNDIYNSNSGSVGIGVTSLSDWGWIIDHALQFANGAFVAGRTDSTAAINLGSNAFVTATGGNAWKYFAAGAATRYIQQVGEHYFQVAGVGSAAGDTITWSTALNIANNGNVGIGTTNPGSKLDVFSAASFRADVATGNPLISIVNNTATSNVAGTATIKFTQANTQAGGKIVSGRDGNYSSGATRTSNLQFYTSTNATDTEKMRINSAGTVLINASAPRISASKLSVQGGMSEFETTLTNGSDWANSPVSILERAHIGLSSADNKYSPNLNFHWSGRVSNSLWMGANGNLNYGTYTSGGVPAVDGTFAAGNLIAASAITGNTGTFTGQVTGPTPTTSTSFANKAYVDAHVSPAGTYLPLAGGTMTTTAKIYFYNTSQYIHANSNNDLTIASGDDINYISNYHRYYNGGTEFARLSATTNSWIANGTNSKLGVNKSTGIDYNLDVEGTLRTTSTAIFEGNVGIGTTSTEGKMTVVGATQTINMDLDANSAVGLSVMGVDSNNFNAFTIGSANSTNNCGVVRFKYNGAGSTNNYLGLGFYGNDDILNVKANGNVGIGTTSPGAKLAVAGDAIIGQGQNRPVSYSSSAGSFRITPNSGGWSTGYFFNNQSEGFLGGFGALGGASDAFSYFWIGDDYNDITMVVQGNAGNVGIGTTSPISKLQVSGTGSQGMQAWFGNGFVNNANYHYSFAKVGFSSEDNDGADTGAGFQFNTRNAADSNWMHGYIYQPQDGGIAFGTGGAGTTQATEKMRIDSAGNVGIGTSSPTNDGATATTLEVRGKSGTGGGVVRVSNAGNTAAARFFAGSASATIATVTNHDLNISTNNSLKMVVKAGGNVGIGTTSPGTKLDVRGSGYFLGTASSGAALVTIENNSGSTATSYGLLVIGGGNSSNGRTFEVRDASGNTDLIVKGDGKVGINNSIPNEKLSVRGNVELVGEGVGDCGIRYIKYNCPDDSTYNVLGLETSGLTIYNRALMPSNGAIIFQNQSNNNQYYIRNSGGTNATFQVGQGTPGSNVRFFINGSGNVGIGNTASTASVKLEVTGNTLLKNSNGVGDLYLGNYATANHFRFHTNNANTYFDMNCGDIYWRQGSSTRYQFFASTANMTIQGTLTQNSDARTKENVVEISDCISKVQAMRGVYYNRTDFNTDVTKVGVIAQEVEAVLPELVLESPETGLKSVAYSELTSVLINAIKEQQEIIEDLKTRITKLEN